MILEGRTLKNKILDDLHEKISELKSKPTLVVIQVGDDTASSIYVKQKEEMCNRVGINFIHEHLSFDINSDDLIDIIEKYNANNDVHGILVQLPLPKHIDQDKVLNAISYKKDVDGLSIVNSGMLIHGKKCLVPCTPLGIIELLKYYNISISGKNVVIVGRSNLVGKPLQNLFLSMDATVTICHSKTSDLSSFTKNADILVVAAGKKDLITDSMVKKDAVVIDVGINRVDGKIYGDVCFNKVKNIASVTPVPGGVGQMTVACLGKNVYDAYLLNNK